MLANALLAQTSTGLAENVQSRVKLMTTRLGLSAEQQSQATTIFTNAATSEVPIHDAIKTARQGLNDAIRSNNTVSIEQLSTTIGNLTAQLTLSQAKARVAFYQILTPEQRAKQAQTENQKPTVISRHAAPGKN